MLRSAAAPIPGLPAAKRVSATTTSNNNAAVNDQEEETNLNNNNNNNMANVNDNNHFSPQAKHPSNSIGYGRTRRQSFAASTSTLLGYGGLNAPQNNKDNISEGMSRRNSSTTTTSLSPSPKHPNSSLSLKHQQQLKEEKEEQDELLRPSESYKKYAKRFQDNNKVIVNVKKSSSNRRSSSKISASPGTGSKKSNSQQQQQDFNNTNSSEQQQQQEEERPPFTVSQSSQFLRRREAEQGEESFLNNNPKKLPLNICSTSPIKDRRRVSATFSHTSHRMSYLPVDVQNNVLKVSEKAERKCSGVIGFHWPVSSGATSTLHHPDNKNNKNDQHHEEEEEFEIDMTFDNTTTPGHQHHNKKKRQRQNFISSPSTNVTTTTDVLNNSSSNVVSPQTNNSTTENESMFSVPYSDESHGTPVFRGGTHPGGTSSLSPAQSPQSLSPTTNASQSPSATSIMQRSAQLATMKFLSPSRAELMHSMKTAKWRQEEEMTLRNANTSEFNNLQQQQNGIGATATSVILSDLSSPLFNSSVSQHQFQSTHEDDFDLMDDDYSPQSRRAKLRDVLSQPLAARYVETFLILLETSGISEQSWHSLNRDIRDMYLNEWKCCALMRTVVLDEFEALVEWANGK